MLSIAAKQSKKTAEAEPSSLTDDTPAIRKRPQPRRKKAAATNPPSPQNDPGDSQQQPRTSPRAQRSGARRASKRSHGESVSEDLTLPDDDDDDSDEQDANTKPAKRIRSGTVTAPNAQASSSRRTPSTSQMILDLTADDLPSNSPPASDTDEQRYAIFFLTQYACNRTHALPPRQSVPLASQLAASRNASEYQYHSPITYLSPIGDPQTQLSFLNEIVLFHAPFPR